MDHSATGFAIPRTWLVLGAIAAVVALGAGVSAALFVLDHGASLSKAITARPRSVGPVYVTVGSVTNHAAVTGAALNTAVYEGIAGALAERAEVTTTPPRSAAARGSRRSARGHVLDANIQVVTAAGGNTRVEVSIVVSSHPSRAYQFESTSAVTMVGAEATPENVASGVRRAMRSATLRAVDQMMQTRM